MCVCVCVCVCVFVFVFVCCSTHESTQLWPQGVCLCLADIMELSPVVTTQHLQYQALIKIIKTLLFLNKFNQTKINLGIFSCIK